MRKPSMPKIPAAATMPAPAAPPTMAQARVPMMSSRASFIPPNVRTGPRGLASAANTAKRSLIGG